jgi:hypothetical protein
MSRYWWIVALVVVAALAAILWATRSAHADVVKTYTTGQAPASGATSVTGTENSAIVAIGNGTTQRTVLLVAVQNYGAAAEVAMLFDAAALPGTGAIPLASCALPAGAAAAPSQCSISFPGDGRVNVQGIVVACSTTGKTLTTDTTIGGNCYFQVGYR